MAEFEVGQPTAEDAKVAQKSQKEFKNIENDFSREIIGAAVEVQRILGVGLLESAYGAALGIELSVRGLIYQRELAVEALYKGQSLGVAYRADFVVESTVLIELKAIETINQTHRAQLLSYLRVSGMKLGLLINFHTFPITKGTHRIVNNL